MAKRSFLRVMLVVIAALLLMNLFRGQISSFIEPEAAAETAQKFMFRGNGVSITCSGDGKYVYAAGNGTIIRSTDYGAMGSWESVIQD